MPPIASETPGCGPCGEPRGRKLIVPGGVTRDRRTIGGRSILALNGVAPAVIFGDCIRVQIPASSSFASIWLKAKVEKHAGYPTCGFFDLNLSWSRMLRPPLVRRSRRRLTSIGASMPHGGIRGQRTGAPPLPPSAPTSQSVQQGQCPQNPCGRGPSTHATRPPCNPSLQPIQS